MKRIYYIIAFIFAGALWLACEDDDEVIYTIPEVSFSEFTDERDGNTYRCVTINGKTWMAENLRYRIPTGSVDGCFTFEETAIDTTKTKVTVSSESFNAAVNQAIDDGLINAPVMVIVYLTMYMDMGYSPAEIIQFIAYSSQDVSDYLQNLYDELLPLALFKWADENYADAENRNGNYASRYGLLYTQEAALKALPEGWRLPTDEDWKELEKALGMLEAEIDLLDEWRGRHGALLKAGGEGIGFNALLAGALVYGSYLHGSNYINKEVNAYFWSSSRVVENDTTDYGITRALFRNHEQILRGTSDLTAAYSVRGVK